VHRGPRHAGPGRPRPLSGVGHRAYRRSSHPGESSLDRLKGQALRARAPPFRAARTRAPGRAVLGELGIVALIDEVTGFQQERASTALAEILERFVAKELARWACAFDLDYYKHLCRLKGMFAPASRSMSSE
jgi:hypothetical protein